ncbi:MAG: DNA methyltransferase [Proteobacteria bacterium]|nr:DNA methyltransferase [Pseudomonadota bacterium]
MSTNSRRSQRKPPYVAKETKSTFKQPPPMIQTTTLWDFPSQHYGEEVQGDGEYAGVTPSYVIWNLLQRYTKPGDKVLDPMCGSGTTLDVCRDLGRIGIGFDIDTKHPDIKKADARKLPLQENSVDFAFVDPPYSNHIKYSGDQRCIGELDARGGGYYEAMEQVIASVYKALKNGGYLGMYIQDSFAKNKDFAPLGFEMFLRLSALMDPVDIVCVMRHNKTMKRNHWHTSAIEGNYYLRGFNYLFVMRKNVARNPDFLKHESSGPLSFFFRQAAAARREEVVTPSRLAEIIKAEQADLDRKFLETSKGQRNSKSKNSDTKDTKQLSSKKSGREAHTNHTGGRKPTSRDSSKKPFKGSFKRKP